MELQLLSENFEVQDAKEKITIADSFVVRQNKIGHGHGEAKLYIGNEGEELRGFFGDDGFVIKCFLLKQDLIKYLEETKVEYLNPEQLYVNRDLLPDLWQERKDKIDSLPDKIEFEINELTQITKPRIYVKSDSIAYKLIRELSLPNITYISIVKLLNQDGDLVYYFRLFADYFGDEVHPYEIEREEEEIEEIETPEERQTVARARRGQGQFREEILRMCPYCPITMVSDERILIASHIKPWSRSNRFEKTDPYNGFMFTPTFDKLFDKGFMSFTNDKKTILSPFLSRMTYSKIGISDNRTIDHLPVSGREDYLEFHRNEILKR
jgi:putative restriction endonuclease